MRDAKVGVYFLRAARSPCDTAHKTPSDHMQAAPMLQPMLGARCGHAGTCTFCPPQHDRGSRGVRQHFACSGAAAPRLRFWVLSAGASGSVLVHRAPSESIRPARTGPRGPPPTCTPRPQLSTCSARCESGRLFPQSSTIAMRYSPQNTFRPHAGSPHAAADARCSLQPWRHMHINAALRGHARGPASAHCIARKRKRHR